jgi:hypothetical protein
MTAFGKRPITRQYAIKMGFSDIVQFFSRHVGPIERYTLSRFFHNFLEISMGSIENTAKIRLKTSHTAIYAINLLFAPPLRESTHKTKINHLRPV